MTHPADREAQTAPSLLDVTVRDLVDRTASSAPTPGGGSVAAVCASMGMALVVMALEVTGGMDEIVDGCRELLTRLEDRADADVVEFEALMAAYRRPKTDPDRSEQIVSATVDATLGPLSLAEIAVSGVQLADAVLSRVKPGIRSDVLAGQDLLRGSVRAACRTADVNIDGLDPSRAEPLRRRRDAAWTAVDGA
jgi:methenyltetrahydrofolate cyclohydrolase